MTLATTATKLGVSFYHYVLFQAEDGIRDYKVTGVQTCALPISGTIFTARATLCRLSGHRSGVAPSCSSEDRSCGACTILSSGDSCHCFVLSSEHHWYLDRKSVV